LLPWPTGVLFYALSVAALSGHGAWRDRRRGARAAQAATLEATALPAISIILPVKGLSFGFERALVALLELDYPDYEIIVGIAEADDPSLEPLRRLQRDHPSGRRLRIVLGEEPRTKNPKLNNLFRPVEAARHGVLAMTDATALVPKDWLRKLIAHLTPETGLVSSLSPAVEPQNTWSAWDAAIVNGYTMRLLAAGDRLGAIAPMGKALLLRRQDLDKIGGVAAMDAGFCEDSALAQAIRKLGLKTVLIDAGTTNPLGPKSFSEVWQRHLRWFNCRRHHAFPVFLIEPWLGFLPLAAGGAFALWFAFGWPAWLTFLCHVPLFAAGEYWLARAERRPTDKWLLVGCLLREALHQIIWCFAFAARRIDWRGSGMVIRRRR